MVKPTGSAILTDKKATATTPQVVTLLVDDSNSMRGIAVGSQSKAEVASAAIFNIVVATQAMSQGSSGYRFVMNVAGFGDTVKAIATAKPAHEIPLGSLKFRGDSGNTNMAAALTWGASALKQALVRCRTIPGYSECDSPPPLVIFLSDGENTGPAVQTAAAELHGIAFECGKVNVIACGVGMKPEHFTVLQAIASHEELAVNIDPAQLADFLSAVGATMEKPNVDHLQQFRGKQTGESAASHAVRESDSSPIVEEPTWAQRYPVEQVTKPVSPGMWARFKEFATGRKK